MHNTHDTNTDISYKSSADEHTLSDTDNARNIIHYPSDNENKNII